MPPASSPRLGPGTGCAPVTFGPGQAGDSAPVGGEPDLVRSRQQPAGPSGSNEGDHAASVPRAGASAHRPDGHDGRSGRCPATAVDPTFVDARVGRSTDSGLADLALAWAHGGSWTADQARA